MYYAIYVTAGKEQLVEVLLMKGLNDSLFERCFHPVRHMRKKLRGEWREIYEKLLPGYVFIETDDMEALYMALKKIPRITRVLGRCGEAEETVFYPLKDEEAEWLDHLTNPGDKIKEKPKPKQSSEAQENPVAEISKIHIGEDDRITILSGPLKGYEGRIKKYDLHRRTAQIEVSFMGRTVLLNLGIEIV